MWLPAWIRRQAVRRPVGTCCLAAAVMIAAGAVVGTAAQAAGASNGWQYAIGTAAHAIVAGLLVGAVRRWPAAGLGPVSRWRSPLALWLAAVFALSPWTSSGLAAPQGLPLAALVSEELGTGLAEEALCRGFMLAVLVRAWGYTPGGVRRAVVVQGLVFGVAHLVVGGLDIVVVSAVLGILFGAAAIRVGSFWPLVPLHAMGNLGYRLVPTEPAASAINDAITLASAIVVTLAVSRYLLRDAALHRRTGDPAGVTDRRAPAAS